MCRRRIGEAVPRRRATGGEERDASVPGVDARLRRVLQGDGWRVSRRRVRQRARRGRRSLRRRIRGIVCRRLPRRLHLCARRGLRERDGGRGRAVRRRQRLRVPGPVSRRLHVRATASDVRQRRRRRGRAVRRRVPRGVRDRVRRLLHLRRAGAGTECRRHRGATARATPRARGIARGRTCEPPSTCGNDVVEPGEACEPGLHDPRAPWAARQMHLRRVRQRRDRGAGRDVRADRRRRLSGPLLVGVVSVSLADHRYVRGCTRARNLPGPRSPEHHRCDDRRDGSGLRVRLRGRGDPAPGHGVVRVRRAQDRARHRGYRRLVLRQRARRLHGNVRRALDGRLQRRHTAQPERAVRVSRRRRHALPPPSGGVHRRGPPAIS